MAGLLSWAALAACSTQPEPVVLEPVLVEAWASLPAAPCPPGMVLVQGSGEVGMRGQPYGFVDIAGLARVDRPEAGCPAAVAASEGAVTCWVRTDEVDPVLPPRPVQVEPYCIEAWPFPGPGVAYTQDGLTPWGAARLGEALGSGRYGQRRLCSMTELQAAVAGLQSNRRFVYGDDAPGARCGQDSMERPVIGADPACRNPETGVRDYGAVLSHWVLADQAFLDHACTPEGGGCRGAGGRTIQPGWLVVGGGTRRVLTRQAPLTPHTWHDHGEPSPDACLGELVWDDQPVVCADPDPAWLQGEASWTAERKTQEDAWRDLVRVARTTGSMAAVLERALGPQWCPGG